MPIDTLIKDGRGSESYAKVTRNGEILTRPFYDFNTTYRVVLSTTNMTNILEPVPGNDFIITSIILNAAKSVVDSAVITVSESASSAGTSTRDILTLDVVKKTTVPLNSLSLRVPDGKFINAITDDATVNITVLGYFMPNHTQFRRDE